MPCTFRCLTNMEGNLKLRQITFILVEGDGLVDVPFRFDLYVYGTALS